MKLIFVLLLSLFASACNGTSTSSPSKENLPHSETEKIAENGDSNEIVEGNVEPQKEKEKAQYYFGVGCVDSKWDPAVNGKPDTECADLSRSDFSGKDLRGAKFNGSNLTFTNFEAVDLSNADLSGADLRWSNIEMAASLQGAHWDAKTQFPVKGYAYMDKIWDLGARQKSIYKNTEKLSNYLLETKNVEIEQVKVSLKAGVHLSELLNTVSEIQTEEILSLLLDASVPKFVLLGTAFEAPEGNLSSSVWNADSSDYVDGLVWKSVENDRFKLLNALGKYPGLLERSSKRRLMSLLSFAVNLGKPEMVKYLVEKGFDLNEMDDLCMFPLSNSRDAIMGELLLDLGAKANPPIGNHCRKPNQIVQVIINYKPVLPLILQVVKRRIDNRNREDRQRDPDETLEIVKLIAKAEDAPKSLSKGMIKRSIPWTYPSSFTKDLLEIFSKAGIEIIDDEN